MSTSQFSIEVFADSAYPALVTVSQLGAGIIDRVEVIPGDCFDVELEDNMTVMVIRAGPLHDIEEAL